MTQVNPEPESAMAAEVPASAEVRHVIVRACTQCGGRREANAPCAQCGNATLPEVSDLGVVIAIYRNPVRRLAWRLVGQPLAERRIRRANRRALLLRADKE